MCSFVATSSAWPVLRGQRRLLTRAATMVLLTASLGPLPGQPAFLPSRPRSQCPTVWAFRSLTVLRRSTFVMLIALHGNWLALGCGCDTPVPSAIPLS